MTRGEKAAVVARATLAAVDACKAASEAIAAAQTSGNGLGVVVPGWRELTFAHSALAGVISEHSRCVVLARAELGDTSTRAEAA